MQNREELFMALTALLAALLIASSQVAQSIPVSLPGTHLYWIVRIAIEALLFFTARQVLERYLTDTVSFAWVTGIAIVVSHVLFVLSVTAMDIVLGYPELGIGTAGTDTQSRVQGIRAGTALPVRQPYCALPAAVTAKAGAGSFWKCCRQSRRPSGCPAIMRAWVNWRQRCCRPSSPPWTGKSSGPRPRSIMIRITTGNEVRMVLCPVLPTSYANCRTRAACRSTAPTGSLAPQLLTRSGTDRT